MVDLDKSYKLSCAEHQFGHGEPDDVIIELESVYKIISVKYWNSEAPYLCGESQERWTKIYKFILTDKYSGAQEDYYVQGKKEAWELLQNCAYEYRAEPFHFNRQPYSMFGRYFKERLSACCFEGIKRIVPPQKWVALERLMG